MPHITTNSTREEYISLWRSVLSQEDDYLPQIIDLGLATTHEKIGVDTLDLVNAKHERLRELKEELTELDQQYVERLSTLKATAAQAEADAQHGDGHEVWARDDRATRMTDFLQGIIVSLNRDYSKIPELQYIMQQVYLFSAGHTDNTQ